MAAKLRPLKDQTIVITGASSGIGLVTARAAAKQGARLILFARNGEALDALEQEINDAGGQAVKVVGDVSDPGDVQRAVDASIEHFGGFETWVNNAGVSVYGRIEEVSLEDHRRVFETNFWGVVHGSIAAIHHFKVRNVRGFGAALINVGSALADRSIPLQGMYCASKHAVKGFTDALRMEVEEAGYPVSVTLIKPAAIDTPYTEHAKNYFQDEPQNPPPVYAPDTVARAILHAAVHPERDLYAGAAGKLFSVLEKYAPRLTDKMMEATMFQQQHSGRPKPTNRIDGFYQPGIGLHERGNYPGFVQERSLYTEARIHPIVTGVILGAIGLAAAAILTGPAVKRR
ncbi:MAG: SDR family oxidoreductase [Planctomycetia bacterium]|nr:SDR family oxidoreductase [Planctomycetia bacterium]